MTAASQATGGLEMDTRWSGEEQDFREKMGDTGEDGMFLMDDVRKWKAVYRLLDHVSTEVFDCGTLCGSACCMNQGMEEMGIYLFPGEHRLFLESSVEVPGGSSVEVPGGSLGGLSGELSAGWANDLSAETFGQNRAAGLSGSRIDGSWLEWETQDPEELGFPPSWTEPVYFVKCKTPPHCPRKWRPLQCRTFPLKPVLSGSGVLELIWNDEELPYTCPIIEKNMPIHDDFYKATYTVWTHLLQDPRIMDLVLLWS